MIIVQNLAQGGAEHMAAETSRAFAEDSDVMIVTFRPEIDYEYSGTYRCIDVAGSGVIGKALGTFVRLHRIKKIKKEFKPDCSISFMPNANFQNVFTKRGEIEISSVRANPEYNVKIGSLKHKIRKTILKRSDIIVTPSLGIKDVIRDYYDLKKKDIRTIYNVCNVNIEKKETTKNNHICKYIYTIGRLAKEKGQWHILKAFAIVHREYPEVKLKIIGDGNLRDELKQLAYDLDISESVIFTGYSKNPIEEMEYGNLFVLTSATESFSNVLIEAMSSGQACISADCNYGPREILNGKNLPPVNRREDALYGVLFPKFKEIEPNYTITINEDERLFASIICDMINNDQLREHYCRVGQERAAYFSFERYKSEWRKLVEEAYEQKI